MKNVAAFFVLIFLTASCSAWGPEGHRIVADIAQSRLAPRARLQVRQLLGNDDLAAISVWADDIRHDRLETFGWHFVDIPSGASGFSESRDCYHPDPKYPSSLQDHHNCVVDRINMFKQVLADRNAPKQDRIEALKFVVHFIGDVHQPLHAIGEARGGNDIHVVEFGSPQCGERPCNLHFVWDIGLIEHTGLSEAQYVTKLNQLLARWKLARGAGGTPEEWANESFQVRKNIWLNDGGSVDEQYYKTAIRIVDQRLALAGIRLAAVLNQVLGR